MVLMDKDYHTFRKGKALWANRREVSFQCTCGSVVRSDERKFQLISSFYVNFVRTGKYQVYGVWVVLNDAAPNLKHASYFILNWAIKGLDTCELVCLNLEVKSRCIVSIVNLSAEWSYMWCKLSQFQSLLKSVSLLLVLVFLSKNYSCTQDWYFVNRYLNLKSSEDWV